MWKKLSKEEQLKFYKKWILDTLKDETPDSLKNHIIKHAHEIFDKDPVEWSASMRNLVDAFDAICSCNPSVELRLRKLDNKYKKDPNRFTPPLKIYEDEEKILRDDMNKFEKKYGIVEDEGVIEYHLKRRMFSIINGKLFLAEPNLSYSHAEWFEKEGWISVDDDELMNKAVRGIIENGNIYFYSGYDFIVNKEIESFFFPYLKELVDLSGLSSDAKVYGGFVRINSNEKMVPRKCYGFVSEFVKR